MRESFRFIVTIGGETLMGTCTDYTCSANAQSYMFNNVVLIDGTRMPFLTAARCPTVITPIKED